MAWRNPYHDPALPHRAVRGFLNPDPSVPIGGDLLRWSRERRAAGLPRPPAEGYAAFARRWRVDADFTAVEPQERARIWWLGHACLLLRAAGRHVLTDPMLSDRASPLRFAGPQRKIPAAAQVGQLPPIDVVLISHNHYDHLDRPSIGALARHARRTGVEPVYVVPLGLAARLRSFGARVVHELDWWQSQRACGLDIHCVPAQHWSARTLWDRNRTLWCGFTVRAGDVGLYFAGDTGYWSGLAQIPQRTGAIDLAALPIGAYAPRWFMQGQHIDPAEAVRLHCELGARHSLAIHWGSFELGDDALDEPPQRLREALADAALSERDFWLLRQGDSRAL